MVDHKKIGERKLLNEAQMTEEALDFYEWPEGAIDTEDSVNEEELLNPEHIRKAAQDNRRTGKIVDVDTEGLV